EKKPFDLFTKNRMDFLFYERSFFSNVIVSSNSASIVVFSLYVALLTMIVMNKFNKNPGTISYNVSVSTGVMPQINTVIAPTIIPLSAPMFVIFLQSSVSKMIGPNEAPNLAQAKETSFKIVSVF